MFPKCHLVFSLFLFCFVLFFVLFGFFSSSFFEAESRALDLYDRESKIGKELVHKLRFPAMMPGKPLIKQRGKELSIETL